jgi:hypothetical protein
MGDVTDFSNFMGPVIDGKSFARQKEAIDHARSNDAEVLVGGGTDDSEGFFVEPTVIQTKNPRDRLMQEEFFGPIVTTYVYPENEWEQTLELVDETAPYGLTGAIFSQERAAIDEAQEALRYAAGNFYVNDKPTGAVVGQQPFGGSRASGTNDKAGSMWNLIRWVSPRTIKETFVPPRDYRYPFLANADSDGKAGDRRRQPLKRAVLVAFVLLLVAASVATAARVRGTRKPDRLQTVNAVRDVVTCGGGYDLATVDGFDRVGQDCETVTRRTSLDPYRNPISEHATEVEPDSAAFGTTVVAVFQVGRYFDGGSHNIGFAVSRNSGKTWKRGFLHGLTPRVSDPAVAYDAKHGEWLAISLVFGQGSYLAISRSSDGQHWSNPVQAVVTRNALGQDKEWIACDNWPSSPHFGSCYISYSDLVGDQVVAQASSDGGLTWSQAVAAPGKPGRGSIDGDFAPGVQPLVLPTGRVLIPFYDQNKLSVVRSDDGGATWTEQIGSRRPTTTSNPGSERRPCPPRR